MHKERFVTVTVKIPKSVYDRIEVLVDRAVYASKSHLIRRAIIDYLEKNHPDEERIIA